MYDPKGWGVHSSTSSTSSSTPRTRQPSSSRVASAASGVRWSSKPIFMHRCNILFLSPSVSSRSWSLSIVIALEARTLPNHTALPGRADMRQFCNDSSRCSFNASVAFLTSSVPPKCDCHIRYVLLRVAVSSLSSFAVAGCFPVFFCAAVGFFLPAARAFLALSYAVLDRSEGAPFAFSRPITKLHCS